ncbi:MAG: 4a-hydroxytetrahydrobiopterin dehydratase [Acidobacteria bacterium]|nr:4a-hydroxytetrahydrobiopterin dehydratase [Acidobacteriota bacterium]
MSLVLTENEIAKELASMPGWRFESGAISKRFNFKRYMAGIEFVEAVAVEAEARDHHPDLLVRYADVTVFCATHSQGGVTENDLSLARAVDRIAAEYQAE